MRWDVPKRRCGWRNQCGRMPSSETRFRTPLEPTMAVLTAPASIKMPTTTTNARKARRSDNGPDQVHRQSANGVIEEILAHRIGDDHHREERHTGGENQAVEKDDESRFFQVPQFRVLDFPVNLGHGLLAAHGQNRVTQANQNADQSDGVWQRRVAQPAQRVVRIHKIREMRPGRKMSSSHPERIAHQRSS